MPSYRCRTCRSEVAVDEIPRWAWREKVMLAGGPDLVYICPACRLDPKAPVPRLDLYHCPSCGTSPIMSPGGAQAAALQRSAGARIGLRPNGEPTYMHLCPACRTTRDHLLADRREAIAFSAAEDVAVQMGRIQQTLDHYRRQGSPEHTLGELSLAAVELHMRVSEAALDPGFLRFLHLLDCASCWERWVLARRPSAGNVHVAAA
jgi:hypothetical protein